MSYGKVANEYELVAFENNGSYWLLDNRMHGRKLSHICVLANTTAAGSGCSELTTDHSMRRLLLRSKPKNNAGPCIVGWKGQNAV